MVGAGTNSVNDVMTSTMMAELALRWETGWQRKGKEATNGSAHMMERSRPQDGRR